MRRVHAARHQRVLSSILATVLLLSMTHMAMAGGYSSTVLSDEPYAYYRFDDAASNAGDSAADAVAGYHGVYAGKPTLVDDVPGRIGGTSLMLPAANPDSYVTATLNSLGSLLGNGVSFEFWIKTTDARPQRRIFGSFNTGNNTTVTVASNSGPAYQPTVGSTQIFMRKQGGGDYAAAFDQSVANIYDGNWHHVVWTAENMATPGPDAYKVYVDGIVVPLTYGATWTSAAFADLENPFYIASAGRAAPLANSFLDAQLDEFAIYDRVLTLEQINRHYEAAWTSPVRALAPAPTAGAINVPYDVVLSWTAGESAATHDVYLGTILEELDAASRSNPLSMLVSQGQNANMYVPGPLVFGQTYYWRVDEVNAAPDFTIFKGEVWSFTIEPVAIPLASEHITATASSRNTAEEGPQNTVNGSGLDADGLHSVEPTHMWLSGVVAAGDSIWIQYDFDKVYALHQMQVWNHNTATESLIGLGIKGATIECSLDGIVWASVDGAHEFARAPGKASYASNTTIDFGGIAAQYVRITVANNWGGVLQQYGLGEIRFLYIPMSARQPSPMDDAVDVEPQLALSWRAGRQAVSHEVYLSSNEKVVVDGIVQAVTVSEPVFDTGMLDLGRSYYWRVDEVNQAADPGVWQGDVWTFSTREYLMVDDFESYSDDEGNRIYQTWIDGFTNDDNGSVVGHMEPPFAERKIVQSGRQSMPLAYDNSRTPFYSEALRTLDSPEDWTVHGADSLRVYFQGQPVTFLERSPGNIVMSAAGTDIFGMTDEFRFVHKQLTGNGSITARVESLDNTNAWAKAGVMIRKDLDVGSTHAMVVISPGNGVSFQRRTLTGDITAQTTQAGIAAPVWLRLTRTGDTFKAEHSADGKTWASVGADIAASSATISMAGPVQIGLALTSHSTDVLTTAQFSEVSATGAISGEWKTTEIGVDHPGNDPAPLYVAVEDAGGRTKVVSHSDLQATTRMGWQAWRIPLSEFATAGVKLNSIKKLAIGIGDRNNPTSGGMGLIYIDDIGFGRPFGNAVPEEPIPIPAGSYSGVILSDEPFAYYRFEDASSNDKDTVADAIGAHNGTYVGNPALIGATPGTIGGTCLEIPGTDSSSYVTASLGALGSVLGEGVSFEFWIKTTDTRVNMRVFGAFNTGSNTSVSVASNSGPAFQKTVGSTQIFMRKQGGGDYGAAFDQSVKNIYDGNWHHVVWTAEKMASPGPDPYKVYVDGILVPLTYGAKWTSAGFADFENPFYIANAGRAAPFANSTIAGQLDEFAVYDSVLTEDQVLGHYQVGVSGNTQ